jgi:hypothetical protein
VQVLWGLQAHRANKVFKVFKAKSAFKATQVLLDPLEVLAL